jgi:hypothetical protein
MPPTPPADNTHGILHRLIGVYLSVAHRNFDPLRTFLEETGASIHHMWKAHASIMRTLARRVSRRGEERPQAIESYWTRAYEPLDRLAKAFAARYRSTYVYVIVLAAVALFCAALALALEALQLEQLVPPVEVGEFTALFLILVMVTRALA